MTLTSDLIKKSLYQSSVFSVVGQHLGPYVNSDCKLWSSNTNCECDQGAHDSWLVTLSANDSLPVVSVSSGFFHFETCGVTPTPKGGSNGGPNGAASQSTVWIIVVIVVGVVIGLIFVFIAVHLRMAKRRARQAAINAAPKGEVTLVFTDVQDSTRLWDVCPNMRDALETHNDIMRDLIEKHNVCAVPL